MGVKPAKNNSNIIFSDYSAVNGEYYLDRLQTSLNSNINRANDSPNNHNMAKPTSSNNLNNINTLRDILKFDEIGPSLTNEANKLLTQYLHSGYPSSSPKFIHLCGIPGSGKSTLASSILKTYNQDAGFVLLSCDDVMEKMSSYKYTLSNSDSKEAFIKCELTARNITYNILSELINRKYPIIFDHSAANENHLDLIKHLNHSGYYTEMHYLPCDVNLAIKRTKQRELITKRHVPVELISERANILEMMIPKYFDSADKFIFYN